jgi:hypothetical protein
LVSVISASKISWITLWAISRKKSGSSSRASRAIRTSGLRMFLVCLDILVPMFYIGYIAYAQQRGKGVMG